MTDASYSPGAEIPDVNSASGKTALKRAGLSIGSMLLGVYGMGAVLTYRADDPSLNVATDDRAHNLFGPPGALFADLLMQSIGAAAPVAMGAIFAAGAIRIARPAAPYTAQDLPAWFSTRRQAPLGAKPLAPCRIAAKP